jgi:ParB-like chromosome segregation protein Spo0J
MKKELTISQTIAQTALAELKVIEELKGLLPVLAEEARRELKTSIEAEGIRDPLIVWKEENAIVDGFNRFEIAKELSLVPDVRYHSFPDIHEAKKWMLRNQLGRRNLTPDERAYFLGQLYNEMKTEKPSTDNNELVKDLSDQFGVSPKTVRRSAEEAKGIDVIAAVKGAAQKAKELSGKGDYTKAERAEIGKASNLTVAQRALTSLDKVKAETKVEEKTKKVIQQALKKAPDIYKGAFVAPNYGPLYNASAEPKPNLEKDAYVFLVVPDEHLNDGFKLVQHWGLVVEGQVIYIGNEKYGGVFTRIDHTSLFICTKGTVIGPDRGKEKPSVQHVTGDPTHEMLKLAETYIRNGKKIDMRKNGPAAGWDGVK